MKTFTTPCFIRTTSDEQKQRIIEQLEKIGYRIAKFYNMDCCNIFTTSDGLYGTTNETERYYSEQNVVGGRVDCGSNIDLFLALAAIIMNNGDGFGGEDDFTQQFDKVTREELVNHFKSKSRDWKYANQNLPFLEEMYSNFTKFRDRGDYVSGEMCEKMMLDWINEMKEILTTT